MKNTSIFSPEFEKKMDSIFSMYEQQNVSSAAIAEDSESINMSPYKEAIQNAETPKQKSAKNKIGELTRK